jgi:hypothetical protein
MQPGQRKYNGLKKRDTYEEIIDYLQDKQQVTKYPDRWAKRIRESPYLTQLDGEGMLEIRDQQEEAMKEQEKEHRIREMVSSGTQSAHEARTSDKTTLVLTRPSDSIDALYNSDLYDIIEGYGASLRTGLTNKRDGVAQTNNFVLKKISTHPSADPPSPRQPSRAPELPQITTDSGPPQPPQQPGMIRRIGKAVVDTIDFATLDIGGWRAEYHDRSTYPTVTGVIDEGAKRLQRELKSRREMVEPEPVRIDTPSPASPGPDPLIIDASSPSRLGSSSVRARGVTRKGKPTDRAEQAVRKIGQVHGLIAGNSGVF